MADGLQPRAQGILNTIGQMLPAGRQPSGAATYPFVPPERVPESLPAPLMGVSAPMPMAEPEPEYQPTPEEGADALVRLGNTSLKQAAARAKRATIPEREAELPPEERRKDQGALKVLGGFLGNREAMAQLAIAFNSMRLRPDAGLAASMQRIVEQGGVRRQANRTAEVLLARGMISPDQAEMIRMGMDYKDVIKGEDQPSKVREYQYAVDQGYKGSYMDFLTSQRAEAPSVSVTTGPQVGTIPQGYQLTSQDGAYRMEPIPGGPAALEAEQREARAGKRAEQEGVRESIVARDVDRLVNMIDRQKQQIFNLPETGIVGNLLATLGINQEAVDFRNTLAGVQATVSFDRLQQMRDASETGGALGSVTERELDLLMSAYGAIQQSTSPQMLKENLQTIKRIMNKIENDPVASAYYRGQPSAMPSQTTPTDGFSVLGRID